MARQSLNKRTLVNPRALKCFEPVAAFIKIFPLENTETVIRPRGVIGFPEIVDIRSDYPNGFRVTVDFFLSLVGRLRGVLRRAKNDGKEKKKIKIKKASHLNPPKVKKSCY